MTKEQTYESYFHKIGITNLEEKEAVIHYVICLLNLAIEAQMGTGEEYDKLC